MYSLFQWTMKLIKICYSLCELVIDLESSFYSGGMPIKPRLLVGCPNWFIIVLFFLSQSPHNKFFSSLKVLLNLILSSCLLSTLTPIVNLFLTAEAVSSRSSPRDQNQEENRFARAKFCTSKLPYSGYISLIQNSNHAPFEVLDSWQKELQYWRISE